MFQSILQFGYISAWPNSPFSQVDNNTFSFRPQLELLGFNVLYWHTVGQSSKQTSCYSNNSLSAKRMWLRMYVKSEHSPLLIPFHGAELLVDSMRKAKSLLCLGFLLTFLFVERQGGGSLWMCSITPGTSLWHFHKIPTTRILVLTKKCAFSDPRKFFLSLKNRKFRN